MALNERFRQFKFRLLPAALIALWAPLALGASASGITYHGRILKPDGAPLEGSSVQFKIQIRSPGSEDCLLYEEVQTKDMHNSGGVFSLTLNDGSGARTDSGAHSFDATFANRGSFSLSGSACASGGSFTPNFADGRSMKVYFRSETMANWESMPAQSVNFSPMAIQSKYVGGFSSRNLLRFDDTAADLNTTTLNSAQFNSLISLINGTSTQYVVNSGSSGATIPSLNGAPATPTAGSIWFDTSSNELKYYNGTGVMVVGAGGGGSGTVTDITVGTGLVDGVGATGTVITTTGTIALPNVGTAGTYYKVTTDAQGRVSSGAASLSEADIPTLTTAGKVSGGAITSGTIGGTTAVNTSGNIVTSGGVSSNTDSTNNLRLFEATNTNRVLVTAPAGVNNYDLVLPTGLPGSSGMVLSSDTSGNLSWVAPSTGSVTSVGVAAPITNSGTASAPVVGITQASTSTDGYLSSSDWNTFNGKLGSTLASGKIWVGNGSNVATAVTPSGDVTMTTAGGFTVTHIQGITVSAVAPTTAGQVLRYDGTSSYVPAQLSTSDISGLTTALGNKIDSSQMPANCAANQTLTFSSPTGAWTCSSIAITGSAFGSQAQNLVLASPDGSAGNPAFRALAANDIPNLSAAKITSGTLVTAQGGTGLNSYAAGDLLYASAPNVLSKLSAGTNGHVLTLSGGVPTWSAPGGSVSLNGITAASAANTIDNLNFAQVWDWSTATTQSPLSVSANALTTGSLLNLTSSSASLNSTDGLLNVANTGASANGVLARFQANSTAGSGMTILTNGNIGIGTTSPTFKLDVDSGGGAAIARFKDSNNPYVDLTDGAKTLRLQIAGDARVGTPDAHPLLLTTGNTERMRIDSGGNVGIGTTTPGVSLDIGAKTDAIALPKGTTAEQPGSPVAGWIRYNTSNNAVEFHNGSAWTTLSSAGGSYLSTGGGTLSGALTISTGGASVTGGLNNNSGNITNAGSITGVGANITGSGAMTVAAGGAAQNLTLSSSTTGSVNVGSGNGTSLQVLDGGASTVNYITVKGAAAGAAPTIGTAGSDANIDLKFAPKGTGNTLFTSGKVGIGTTNPVVPLDVREGVSNQSGTVTQSLLTSSHTTNGTYDDYGAMFGNHAKIAAGVTNSGIEVGSYSFALRNYSTSADSGTATAQIGSVIAYGHFNSDGAATPQTTNAFGLIVNPYYTTGTIANMYDIFIGSDATGGTATNHYGFFQANNATNVFNGNVGIGTTSPMSTIHVSRNDDTSQLFLERTGGAGTGQFAGIHARFYKDTGTGDPHIFLSAARGTSTSPLATATNDTLGAIDFYGYGDTAFKRGAEIVASAEGAFTDSSSPAMLRFFTTPSGSTSASERIRINASGNVGVGTASPSARLEVSSGTANVSGLKFTNFTSTAPTGTGQPVGVDASGNLVTISVSGSGTVSSGTQNQLAYYGANGSAVSGLATAANGVLVTDGSGVPSISSTLPLSAQSNITQTGTITSGTWNGTAIGTQYGGTGLNASAAANGQLLIGNGTGFTLAGITGTANRVSVTNGAGSITLSAPQDIHSGASPTFTGLTLSGLSNGFVKSTSGVLSGGNTVSLTTDVGGVLPVANGGTGSNDGSIAGTGALSFAAGGSNQNVTLTPSGTGATILGGNVGIGTTNPSNLLSIDKPSSVASQTFANLSVNGNDIMTLGEDIVGNYGGALFLKDGVGGAGNAGFRYNGGFPYITTTQNNFSISGSGFSATLTSAYMNFTTGGVSRLMLLNGGNVGIGTTTPGVSLDISAKTDAIALPKGTTAQQPGSPVSGWIRYNTSNNAVEFYNGSAWATLSTAGGSYLSTSGGTLSGALTISSGGASITGGLNNNSGGITGAGSITGVGANITGSGAMTVAAGGTAQNLTLSSSTTGSVNVGSGNGTSLSILDGGASTVNYVTVKGAAAGGSPTIATAGSDANINLTFTPKGTGKTIFSSGNVGIGTTSPIATFDVMATNTGVGTSYPNYATSQLGGVNPHYVNSNNITRVTLAPTADTSASTLNSGVTGWVDLPVTSSANTVWNSAGVHGVVTNESTETSNASGWAGFSGVLGEYSNNGTNNYYGAGLNGQAENGSGFVYELMGANLSAYQNGGSSTYNIGIYSYAETGGGTNTSLYGGDIEAKVSAGTVTSSYGLYVKNSFTGGTLSNRYGIYLNTMSGTPSTKDYALYIAATQPNYLAGNVGIGTTTPNVNLDIRQAGTGTAAISLGNITNGSYGTLTFSNGTGLPLQILPGTGNDLVLGANGSEKVRILSSNGNVGIGTTTPGVSLDISAKTDAIALPKGTTAQQPGSPVAGWIRYNTSNNVVEFYNGSAWTTLSTGGGSYLSTSGGTLSGALTISSGGASVTGGINNNSGNITNAGSITGVGANITGSGAMTVAAGGTAQNLTLRSSTTGSVNVGSGNGTSLSVLDGGASTVNYVTVKGAAAGSSPAIATAGSDANINLTFTPKGTGNTIFSSGNVGIGTTSPTTTLHVVGDLAIDKSGNPWINFLSGGSYEWDMEGDGASFNINESNVGARFTIRTGGNVGIGAPSAGSKLVVDTSTAWDGIKLTNAGNDAGFIVNNASGGTVLGLNSSGVRKVNLDSDGVSYVLGGNVGIGTTTPASKLQVNGAITNAVSTYSSAFTCGTSTLDLSASNFIRFNPSNTIAAGTCNMALSNLVPGGSYTIVMTGAGATTNAITYNFTGYTFKYVPTNAATTAAKDSIYTLLYDGTTVYVTWGKGY